MQNICIAEYIYAEYMYAEYIYAEYMSSRIYVK